MITLSSAGFFFGGASEGTVEAPSQDTGGVNA
jgi:hypothetical protein